MSGEKVLYTILSSFFIGSTIVPFRDRAAFWYYCLYLDVL